MKEKTMNPTTIEWVLNPDGGQGYTSNPLTGCLGPKGDGINCPYCYARNLANGRLKQRYLANIDVAPRFEEDGSRFNRYEDLHNPFYPRFWPERLKDLDVKSPKGVFVCDMSDWCAPSLPTAWKEALMAAIRKNPQHRIYLLTHQPQELPQWSPFPENCWVGVTVTNKREYQQALAGLNAIEARVKYISFEPLLGPVPVLFSYAFDKNDIDWVIIGAMTGRNADLFRLARQYPGLAPAFDWKIRTLQPNRNWVADIVRAADKAHIPVFLKDNLMPLFPEALRDSESAPPLFFTPPSRLSLTNGWDYRQEMPE